MLVRCVFVGRKFHQWIAILFSFFSSKDGNTWWSCSHVNKFKRELNTVVTDFSFQIKAQFNLICWAFLFRNLGGTFVHFQFHLWKINLIDTNYKKWPKRFKFDFNTNWWIIEKLACACHIHIKERNEMCLACKIFAFSVYFIFSFILEVNKLTHDTHNRCP